MNLCWNCGSVNILYDEEERKPYCLMCRRFQPNGNGSGKKNGRKNGRPQRVRYLHEDTLLINREVKAE